MSNCCPCLDNGCGPGVTLGAHTIILGMEQSHLWGTSPPQGGFASTGSFLISAQALHPNASLGQRDRLAAARDFERLLCVSVCVLQLYYMCAVHW